MIGAVDIGGTKIAVGMVDNGGKVVSRMEAPTDPDRYTHARTSHHSTSRPQAEGEAATGCLPFSR